MASAYSQDLRDRVNDAVVGGKMSRRSAAARFAVSESSAIKGVQRFNWLLVLFLAGAYAIGLGLRSQAQRLGFLPPEL